MTDKKHQTFYTAAIGTRLQSRLSAILEELSKVQAATHPDSYTAIQITTIKSQIGRCKVSLLAETEKLTTLLRMPAELQGDKHV